MVIRRPFCNRELTLELSFNCLHSSPVPSFETESAVVAWTSLSDTLTGGIIIVSVDSAEPIVSLGSSMRLLTKKLLQYLALWVYCQDYWQRHRASKCYLQRPLMTRLLPWLLRKVSICLVRAASQMAALRITAIV